MNGSLIALDRSCDLHQIAPGVWGDGSSGRDPCPTRVYCTKSSHFWRLGGRLGRGPGIIRCDVEVRVRPKLFRIVIRMDGGFKTTGLGPWTRASLVSVLRRRDTREEETRVPPPIYRFEARTHVSRV